jgi:hypothetical protein
MRQLTHLNMRRAKDEGGRMKGERFARTHPSSFLLHPSIAFRVIAATEAPGA